ncbi:hypothetical protein [Marmoricola sp. RAF53]|uniref:hypothetical protein n=1 Tax=Marmoricola sp. RAF53 TaxID=3233059 RepID=UPI003F9D1B13
MSLDPLGPSTTEVLVSLAFLVLYVGVLVLWPALDAGRRGRWGWVAGVVLLSPLGGILWLVWARRSPAYQVAR